MNHRLAAPILVKPPVLQRHASPVVLLVGNFLSRHGRTRGVCEELALRLAGAGWNVITTSNRLSRFPRAADMVSTAWRRRGRYEVAHIDVFSGSSFLWAEAVAWTVKRARKPYVLTLHGGNLPRFAGQWPVRAQRLLSGAAVVTTPSAYLLEHMAAYRRDLHLVPNAFDMHNYHARNRSTLRPNLIWLRAFHEVYNPTLVVRALPALAHDFPDLRVTMYGPDRDGSLATVKRMAAELGVAARLALPGLVPKSRVPQALSAGDIFLNTSNIDNTPVSVMEAMASGMCVISTAVGGMRYLVRHEVDGLLVPADDPAALAGAVRRVLREPGLARRLSANARARAADWDWSRILPLWQELLLQAAR